MDASSYRGQRGPNGLSVYVAKSETRDRRLSPRLHRFRRTPPNRRCRVSRVVRQRPEEGRAMSVLIAEDFLVFRGLDLSFAEAALLCDALNGLTFSPDDEESPWAMIEYVVVLDKLDRKWLADPRRLMPKLRALGSHACLALGRAASCFWEQREVPTPERLRAAGLIA